MYLDEVLGPIVGSFVLWGFLIAFLFNLSLYTSCRFKNHDIFYFSLIMLASYASTEFVMFTESPYVTWALFDIGTLFIIHAVARLKAFKGRVALVYLTFGLSINFLLNFALHLDLYYRNNTDSWWLWSLYSMGINLSDFMMMFALIIQRDFLAIYRLYSKLLSPKLAGTQ